MTTYIEYGVKLTDGQKSKLASAILNKSPLTLPLKHSSRFWWVNADKKTN